jgi:hypothetical protein
MEMAVTMSKLRALALIEGNPLPRVNNMAENSIFLAQLGMFHRRSRTKDLVEVVSKLLFAADICYNMNNVVIADAVA